MIEIQIGEGFVGSGPNAAHTNTILGARSGPAGVAWATALATPRAGHVPYMVVAQPGVAVTPPTLFVNKAAVENDQHGLFTWGAAQAGVAAGVGEALRTGIIDVNSIDDLVIIAAIWLNPSANDEEEVYQNQRQAMIDALTNGKNGKPTAADVIKASENVANPFFRQK
ncbi:COG1795 Formaldehyde-activating enzyme nesessary for methanogenesis [Candidatus Nanopelagicaceae bacterium]